MTETMSRVPLSRWPKGIERIVPDTLTYSAVSARRFRTACLRAERPVLLAVKNPFDMSHPRDGNYGQHRHGWG